MPDHLRTRIWNAFYEEIFSKIGDPEVQSLNDQFDPLPYEYLRLLWGKFFGQNLQVVSKCSYIKQVSMMYGSFAELEWFAIYEFIEFLVKNYKNTNTTRNIMRKIDTAFIEERSPYRIIQGLVVPLTSEEEIKEIEKVFNIPDKYSSVEDHFEKALKFLSLRPEADYINSIKESISAIESLVEILKGKKGTLGDLIHELDIHPALRNGFAKLYGWTSSEKTGIRHGQYGDLMQPGEFEARYMLITCSAFINYLIAKLDAGINNE